MCFLFESFKFLETNIQKFLSSERHLDAHAQKRPINTKYNKFISNYREVCFFQPLRLKVCASNFALQTQMKSHFTAKLKLGKVLGA